MAIKTRNIYTLAAVRLNLDDLANYIPARIAALCMIVAAYLLSLDAKRAWRTFKRDRYNHLSPNSAMTESVTAGALNIQLGGGHFYFGKWVPKDTIGDDLRPDRSRRHRANE